MKFKNHFMFCFLVLVLSGCVKLEPELGEAFEQTAELSTTSFIYYIHNSSWPGSIEELKFFCSQNQEKCLPLDWNKYTNVIFEILPDESLRLKLYISGGPNESANSQETKAFVTLPKPDIQKSIDEIGQGESGCPGKS